MVGYTVNRDPDGVTIYKDKKEIFIDKREAAHLQKLIKLARKEYWKRFRI